MALQYYQTQIDYMSLKCSKLYFTANIIAREEIWIIADNDSADKMIKFHQLKNLTSSDLVLAQWYIFASFDIYTQTASSIGNAFQQLERGLLKTMEERIRPPHSIIFILGDSLLDDKQLNFVPENLFAVLSRMLRQLKQQVNNYVELLPGKAKPLKEIKLFVTKPLPKPENLFRGRAMELMRLAKNRHAYNQKLVGAIQQHHWNFLNPGIQPTNGRAFQKLKDSKGKDKYTLTLDGLHQYWYAINTGLEKLHKGLIGCKDNKDTH